MAQIIKGMSTDGLAVISLNASTGDITGVHLDSRISELEHSLLEETVLTAIQDAQKRHSRKVRSQ